MMSLFNKHSIKSLNKIIVGAERSFEDLIQLGLLFESVVVHCVYFLDYLLIRIYVLLCVAMDSIDYLITRLDKKLNIVDLIQVKRSSVLDAVQVVIDHLLQLVIFFFRIIFLLGIQILVFINQKINIGVSHQLALQSEVSHINSHLDFRLLY